VETENPAKFWDAHNLLKPDGPVCLIIKATMGVAADLDRFQPAGFPEVGHVIYDAPRSAGSSEKVCIVDSPASMANHLEQVCMSDEEALHPDLAGLPYVKCVTDRNPVIEGGNVTLKADDPRDRVVTTSLTEGHRIASDYFLDASRLTSRNESEGESLRGLLRREFQIIEVKKDKTYFIPPEAWWSIYGILFKYDPNSLVHGVLFAKEQIKISRVLTAHLEAFGAARVGRSGVKFDRLGRTTSGQPIFGVDEETAREIRATFIIDLALLRSYGRDGQDSSTGLGLNTKQKELLLALALWKIGKLLACPFRYRSGCQLRMREVAFTSDSHREGDQPLANELPGIDIRQAISGAYPKPSQLSESGQAAPYEPVTRVYYPFDQLFKTGKADSAPTASDADAGDEGSEGESEG
jgi:CRISPR-associated protein Csb1